MNSELSPVYPQHTKTQAPTTTPKQSNHISQAFIHPQQYHHANCYSKPSHRNHHDVHDDDFRAYG